MRPVHHEPPWRETEWLTPPARARRRNIRVRRSQASHESGSVIDQLRADGAVALVRFGRGSRKLVPVVLDDPAFVDIDTMRCPLVQIAEPPDRNAEPLRRLPLPFLDCAAGGCRDNLPHPLEDELARAVSRELTRFHFLPMPCRPELSEFRPLREAPG